MRTEYPVKFSREQAERLAADIQAYWQKRGCSIDVWVEPISQTYANDYAVRSNLRLRSRRQSEDEPKS